MEAASIHGDAHRPPFTMHAFTGLGAPAMTVARRVRVHGVVQGVGYRWSCVRQATALGISGWVRNRVDGSVEALLCGEAEVVDRMLAWMRHDVPGARVASLACQEVPLPEPLPTGFEQQPTA